jgi:hypothetical protein
MRAIGHTPVEMRVETIPLAVRVRAAAEEISRHDLARANQLYAFAEELRAAG